MSAGCGCVCVRFWGCDRTCFFIINKISFDKKEDDDEEVEEEECEMAWYLSWKWVESDFRWYSHFFMLFVYAYIELGFVRLMFRSLSFKKMSEDKTEWKVTI